MVHEAMVLEYSGRHLAMIELAAVAQAAALRLADRLPVRALGHRRRRRRADAAASIGVAAYLGKLVAGGVLLAVFETSIAKMRVFRVPDFLGAALMLGLLGDAAALRVAELLMHGLDLRRRASCWPAALVLVSFMHALPGPALRR